MTKNKIETKTEKKTETKIKEVEVIEEVEPKAEKLDYHLYAELNDKTFETDTNDIRSAILEIEPKELLKTALLIRVTNKKGKTIERYLYLREAKKLWINEYYLQHFIKYLIF